MKLSQDKYFVICRELKKRRKKGFVINDLFTNSKDAGQAFSSLRQCSADEIDNHELGFGNNEEKKLKKDKLILILDCPANVWVRPAGYAMECEKNGKELAPYSVSRGLECRSYGISIEKMHYLVLDEAATANFFHTSAGADKVSATLATVARAMQPLSSKIPPQKMNPAHSS